jgi:hypothetical protein
MNINSNFLTNAQSPEEAAQIFAALASKAMAEILSKTITDALGAVSLQSANPAIQGWQDMVQGCAVNLCWERPLGRPAGQVCVFSPYAPTGVSSLGGITGSIGISISASF